MKYTNDDFSRADKELLKFLLRSGKSLPEAEKIVRETRSRVIRQLTR